MARLGYSRILPAVLLDGAAWLLLPSPWSMLAGSALLLVIILLVQFYRDPEREAPKGAPGRYLLSPADGRVVAVNRGPDSLRISIFLSAFDVHVNRAPISGRVLELAHSPGRFLPAFLERSSTENERVRMRIETPDSGQVVCTQVAGLLARRIENWIEVGQVLTQGERYGMIHLGSRVDLELPLEFGARVQEGDRVRGGESVLAERPVG